jgi:hypothetical protein
VKAHFQNFGVGDCAAMIYDDAPGSTAAGNAKMTGAKVANDGPFESPTTAK